MMKCMGSRVTATGTFLFATWRLDERPTVVWQSVVVSVVALLVSAVRVCTLQLQPAPGSEKNSGASRLASTPILPSAVCAWVGSHQLASFMASSVMPK